MKLMLFTKDGCSKCEKLKQYIKKLGIAYEEKNIEHYEGLAEYSYVFQNGPWSWGEVPAIYDGRTFTCGHIRSKKLIQRLKKEK